MFLVHLAVAQQSIAPEKSLDFWLGTWVVTAKSKTAKPGEWQSERGTNEIRRTLGDKVIQENFHAPSLVGKSWSVYNPTTKIWKQTWVDANGGYFAFTGGPDGKNFIFKTAEVNGVVLRMVFRDIQKDTIHWDWERSADSGKTWTVMMQIDYVREKSAKKG